jgi:hypothetical protein
MGENHCPYGLFSDISAFNFIDIHQSRTHGHKKAQELGRVARWRKKRKVGFIVEKRKLHTTGHPQKKRALELPKTRI